MTSDTFCHWKPLLQKVGAVVILFLVDLLLAVGADGKVLITPNNRATSTQKDAAVLGVLSHTPSRHQEGYEQGPRAMGSGTPRMDVSFATLKFDSSVI